MQQHTATPRPPGSQRIVRSGPGGKRWVSWRQIPLLAILLWVFLYLPTRGPALQRARLGYLFAALGLLILCLNLIMIAKRRSVVPVLLSLFGMGAALGLTDEWPLRLAGILGAIAVDASALLWSRSRHP